MIHSIFFRSRNSEIFLEKHYRSYISKTECENFLDQKTFKNENDISPIIETTNYIIFNIYRNEIYILAFCKTETPPLFVIEFLKCIEAIIIEYYGAFNLENVKDNIVQIYELLDEMVDNGYPLATEPNILKALIKPPTFLRNIASAVSKSAMSRNVSSNLPVNQLSNIRWRQEGLKYDFNEAYFDFTEELSAIVDKSGNLVLAQVFGYIDCLVRLSGMPDLTMSFLDPRMLENVSLHPCVRFSRWEKQSIISFIPPDGKFRLFTFQINNLLLMNLPISVSHSIYSKETGNRFDMSINIKASAGKPVEGLRVTANMPPEVMNIQFTACTRGKPSYDSTKKVFKWIIGKVETSGPYPSIKGTMSLSEGQGTKFSFNPTISVDFCINQHTVSGVRINRLDMFGEKYKPFKGVKYVTKSSLFEVRT